MLVINNNRLHQTHIVFINNYMNIKVEVLMDDANN